MSGGTTVPGEVRMKIGLKIPAVLIGMALAAGTFAPAARAEDQPHMRAALEHLKAARAELEKAEHDKGGHRAKAKQLTDQAIAQVQQGIGYDNRHESRKEERRENH